MLQWNDTMFNDAFSKVPSEESNSEDNLPPMPKWAMKSKAIGGNIVFVDGKWKIRFS